MRRADRLFQIVQYLRGGRLTTARDLAEKLEVSERTIYRDVADLIGSGVPVEGEAGVGYVMRGGYEVPPLMFTRDEVVALVAGIRMVRAWGGLEMAKAAEEALIKIEAVLPESARARADGVQIYALSEWSISAEARARLDVIDQAIELKIKLILAYEDVDGQVTGRQVRPLGLFFWGKVWTLVAWCELRDDFRMFRVDRIQDLEEGAGFRLEKGKTIRDFYDQQVPSHARC